MKKLKCFVEEFNTSNARDRTVLLETIFNSYNKNIDLNKFITSWKFYLGDKSEAFDFLYLKMDEWNKSDRNLFNKIKTIFPSDSIKTLEQFNLICQEKMSFEDVIVKFTNVPFMKGLIKQLVMEANLTKFILMVLEGSKDSFADVEVPCYYKTLVFSDPFLLGCLVKSNYKYYDLFLTDERKLDLNNLANLPLLEDLIDCNGGIVEYLKSHEKYLSLSRKAYLNKIFKKKAYDFEDRINSKNFNDISIECEVDTDETVDGNFNFLDMISVEYLKGDVYSYTPEIEPDVSKNIDLEPPTPTHTGLKNFIAANQIPDLPNSSDDEDKGKSRVCEPNLNDWYSFK